MTIRRRRTRQRTPDKRDRGRKSVPQFSPAEWDEATLTLWQRQRGRCARCPESVDQSAERHHRQRRQVGGDRLSNLILLHPHCHAWAHQHPEAARAAGLIVSSYEADPAAVPLVVDGRIMLLDDAGGMRPLP